MTIYIEDIEEMLDANDNQYNADMTEAMLDAIEDADANGSTIERRD